MLLSSGGSHGEVVLNEVAKLQNNVVGIDAFAVDFALQLGQNQGQGRLFEGNSFQELAIRDESAELPSQRFFRFYNEIPVSTAFCIVHSR